MKNLLLSVLIVVSASLGFAQQGVQAYPNQVATTNTAPVAQGVSQARQSAMPWESGYRKQKRWAVDLDFQAGVTDDDVAPDIAGISLEAGVFLDKYCHHKLSLTLGLMGGNTDYWLVGSDDSLWYEDTSMTQIPLMLGYTFSSYITKKVDFYISAKGGFVFNNVSVDSYGEFYDAGHIYYGYGDENYRETNTGMSFGAGIRWRMSDQWSFKVGYEYLKTFGDTYYSKNIQQSNKDLAYHCIKLGFLCEF